VSLTIANSCPNCGHRWHRRKAKGRPKTAYFTAFGMTKHIDDWSFELDLSLTSLRYYATKHAGDFEKAVMEIRARQDKSKNPIRTANEDRRKIIMVGNKGFLGPETKRGQG
jgi:hypothetical protein